MKTEDDDDDLEHIAVAEQLSRLQLNAVGDRFFGPSSSFHLIRKAMSVKENFTGLPQSEPTKRPVYWNIQPASPSCPCVWSLRLLNSPFPVGNGIGRKRPTPLSFSSTRSAGRFDRLILPECTSFLPIYSSTHFSNGYSPQDTSSEP